MKKKRNTRFRVSDFLVIFVCFFGTLVSLWFFWEDFNAVLEKLNEQPIATVTWKKKASQRKLSDNLVWDRLQQHSYVYNGDTIRTSSGAEATITFADSQIELGENTIIQILYEQNAATVDLASGFVSASTQSGDANSNLQIKTGNVTVAVGQGSVLSANAVANMPTQFQVLSGQVILLDDTNGSQTFSEGSNLVVKDGGQIVPPPIEVLTPSLQSRYLIFDTDVLPVTFNWKTRNIPTGAQVVFETSLDSDFEELTNQTILDGLNSLTVNLNVESHYWRFYITENQEINKDSLVSGKISVLYAKSPEITVPAEGDTFYYRSKPPTIRFFWTGNDYVSTYLFEVANNPEMRNPVISQTSQNLSSLVTNLTAGKWYWRITPYYTINSMGYYAPTETGSFEVIQQPQLAAPQTLFPSEGAFVNARASTDSETNEVVLSWKSEKEADHYTVQISSSPDMKNSLITETTRNNYLSVTLPTLGKWYWQLVQVDAEGNTSPKSDLKSFLAMDKEVLFNQMFPPEGYKISDTRLRDIKFTWKNNVQQPFLVQISDRADFSTITYEQELSPSMLSLTGLELANGTWYWRLVSGNGESTELTTPVRSFEVLPQLPAPVVTKAVNGSSVILKPGEELELAWGPLEGAHYYNVFLYSVNDNSINVKERFITDTSLKINTDSMIPGTYHWTIQAFIDETAASTRFTSILAESTFDLVKIYPVQLENYKNNVELNGVEAYLNPGTLQFSSNSPIKEYQIMVVREPYGERLPTTYQGTYNIPQQSVVYKGLSTQLPPLTPGDYAWNVTAITPNNLDISAEDFGTFTVLPLEPLEQSDIVSPQRKSVFDESYLMDTTLVTLEWTSVPEAEAYSVTVVNEDTGKTILNEIITDTTYTIDLVELGEGKFTCSVAGRQYIPQDRENYKTAVPLRTGKPALSEFEVRLTPHNFEVNDLGDLYGNY